MAGAAGKFTPQLLWPELIITSGIIFRLRIAESGDTAGPGVGADRKPHGTEKVGAGLHHDDRIGGANDAEAELPGGHATKPPAHFQKWNPSQWFLADNRQWLGRQKRRLHNLAEHTN